VKDGCLALKRNDKSFRDSKRRVAEFKSFFIKTLYHWTAALDRNLLGFHDFLDLFSLSS
jgi:hypothetical protein